MCGCVHVWVRACVGACMCGCVRACVRACVAACVRACERACVRARACARKHVCMWVRVAACGRTCPVFVLGDPNHATVSQYSLLHLQYFVMPVDVFCSLTYVVYKRLSPHALPQYIPSGRWTLCGYKLVQGRGERHDAIDDERYLVRVVVRHSTGRGARIAFTTRFQLGRPTAGIDDMPFRPLLYYYICHD